MLKGDNINGAKTVVDQIKVIYCLIFYSAPHKFEQR